MKAKASHSYFHIENPIKCLRRLTAALSDFLFCRCLQKLTGHQDVIKNVISCCLVIQIKLKRRFSRQQNSVAATMPACFYIVWFATPTELFQELVRVFCRVFGSIGNWVRQNVRKLTRIFSGGTLTALEGPITTRQKQFATDAF